ncbi:MAG: hypothetical protein DSY37_02970 [Hyperthermus sp.]|nr:MAG: hypothetical protein DSY37_02970 [Hyperthermus sp.]
MDTASGIQCFESGWCDYSGEHARVRSEVEGLIRSYVEGSASEYWMAVVVASYGSGKTALLRHLEWFSRSRLGVAVLRVEFADIVDFILERYGSIHESRLPQVVREFVESRLGAVNGVVVLLIDEVEESYDVFRGIVEHETSPLRGLAEAIRTRSIPVYVVLALGPSSTLKEAVFGPVAWRSRVYTIPLLPKNIIEGQLEGLVDDPALRGLVANMVWWASKGRVAWVKLMVDSIVPGLMDAFKSGVERVEAFLLGEEALTREIVEGIPLFDRQGYRDVKRFIDDPKIAPILAVLPGPVPLSIVERLVGGGIMVGSGPVTGVTRLGLRSSELVDAAASWMEKAARIWNVSGQSVERALTVLEYVVSAYENGGVLPYDPQLLRELFTIAADVSREIYGDDPNVARILESLNPDIIAPEPFRLEEPVVYLKPGMLTRIYPIAGSSPLVGCARKAGVDQVSRVVDDLSPEELAEHWERVKGFLGLNTIEERRGISILIASPPLLHHVARVAACRAVSGEKTIVLLPAVREDARIGASISKALESLGVPIVAMGQRLSLFTYALLYALTIGLHGCMPENLGSSEKRSIQIYTDMLKSVILDAMSHNTSVLDRLRATLSRMEQPIPSALAERIGSVASKGEEALEAEIESLKNTIPTVQKLIREISAVTGVKPAREIVVKRAVLEEVKDAIAGVLDQLPRLQSLLEGCEATSGLQLLDMLLGLKGSGEDGESMLARLRRISEMITGMPRVGSLEKLSKLLEVLSESLPAILPVVNEDALEELLIRLEERLDRIAKLYRQVHDAADPLPAKVRDELEKALRADVASMRDLASLEKYLENAIGLLGRLTGMSDSLHMIESIEEEKKMITARIAGLFGIEESRYDAREEALIGGEGL